MTKAKVTIIGCPQCESKVSAEIVAEQSYFFEHMDFPAKVGLLKCSVCDMVIVGHSEMFQTDFDKAEFDPYTRLWPAPDNTISWKLPDSVKRSLEEAERCFSAKAYSACAVMCGKALESLCKEQGVTGRLFESLKELKTKGIIDGRLFEWSEALRETRNLGAHASDHDINGKDARDILDFTIAICDYVYVLSDKYRQFKDRQVKKK